MSIMRRKEYAVSLGLATPGRGRMSREALDAIEKARGEGMVFSDDDTPRSPQKPSQGPTEASVPTGPKYTHQRHESVSADITWRYPGGLDQQFEGIDSNGKKHKVSGRNACECGYSLVGHICDNPTSLIGSPLERISVRPV